MRKGYLHKVVQLHRQSIPDTRKGTAHFRATRVRLGTSRAAKISHLGVSIHYIKTASFHVCQSFGERKTVRRFGHFKMSVLLLMRATSSASSAVMAQAKRPYAKS